MPEWQEGRSGEVGRPGPPVGEEGVKVRTWMTMRTEDGTTGLKMGPCEPKGAGAAWTEERRRSDEGRKRLKGARRRVGELGPQLAF